MTTLIQVKKTKSVKMYHDTDEFGVWIHIGARQIFIPMSKIYQVKRGLESEVQRFYRRKIFNVSLSLKML